MKIWLNIWRTKLGKAWVITSGILTVLMVVVMLVTTQVSLIYGTLNLVFGGERLDAAHAYNLYDNEPYFKPDQDTKEASVEANKKIAQEINEQGIVLLKNTDSALPLTETQPKVSVFGKNSVNMVYGGTGSGGRSASSSINLYSALEQAGIQYNPTLKSFYEDNGKSGNGRPGSPNMGDILTGFPIGETPVSKYQTSETSTYSQYHDAAIIVLTRIGGEGYDLPRSMYWDGSSYKNWNSTARTPVEGAWSWDSHYLELDKNEADLIAHVCDNFDNVIIVLNSGTSMELGFLEDGDFWTEHNYSVNYSEKITAALWAGNPGEIGNLALAKILKGDVNPSGRTVDTFVKDFTKDPTWYNFGNNLKNKGNEYYLGAEGTSVNGGTYFCNYEEGIYMGYRYWETRGYVEDDDYDWYDENVVYPFGYGLSYDYDFGWEVLSCKYTDGTEIDYDDLKKDGTIEIKVQVTNNGSKAGRDVVELYYSPEYYDGEVEKSHVTLGDFAKTGLIAPGGGTGEVTLTLKVSDMASYDWNDANGNGHKGYELDEGEYILYLARNAHDHSEDEDETIQFSFYVSGGDFTKGTNGYAYDNGVYSTVQNVFDDVSAGPNKEISYVSREDFEGTVPTEFPYEKGLNVYATNSENIAFFDDFKLPGNKNEYDKDKPWFVAEDKKPVYGQSGTVTLKDMVGKDYNHEDWDKLLNQLTVSEMNKLIGIGAFETQQISSVEKPKTHDWDGPGGFVVGSFMSMTGEDSTVVCFWPCESLIAATWSKELAEKMGNALGNEGLWGSENDDYTFSGWYAPAVNIHRSQFGGRNFEYYSEDPILSGKIAANVCKGASDKGLITYVKHFAFNDQETNRSDNGYAVWATEQTLREIYLKPFEYAVKEGKSLGIMTSFNRVGKTWTGASYALLTQILKNEWGFHGTIITDYNNGAGSYMDLDLMIRAGGNLNLFQSTWLSVGGSDLTATHLTAMRNACHDILYATANSMAMNNPYGPMLLPVWVVIMISVCAGIFACLIGWGVYVILRAVKKSKQEEGKNETAASAK